MLEGGLIGLPPGVLLLHYIGPALFSAISRHPVGYLVPADAMRLASCRAFEAVVGWPTAGRSYGRADRASASLVEQSTSLGSRHPALGDSEI